MAETDVRRLLAALAGDDTGDGEDGGSVHDDIEYGTLIDRATAATEDVAAVTAFLAHLTCPERQTEMDGRYQPICETHHRLNANLASLDG